MTVVIVGSINQDVVVRVQRIPSPGETVLASSLIRSGGGKGANQAVGARRAGDAEVAFVGAIGRDADGATLREALRADGIDVTGLMEVDAPTGTALISVDDAAENAIVVAAGANALSHRLTEGQKAVVERASVLLTQLEVPVSFVRDAARATPDSAWHVLNAAPSAPLAGAEQDLLETVDVLVVNEHEACDIAGLNDLDAAVTILGERVKALVVTLGHRGSLVLCDGERAEVPAFAAAAVDTTGAGDTFCGMFAAYLARTGRHPETMDAALLAEAARFGAAAAALAVTRPGAQDAVPTAAEVAALIEKAQTSS